MGAVPAAAPTSAPVGGLGIMEEVAVDKPHRHHYRRRSARKSCSCVRRHLRPPLHGLASMEPRRDVARLVARQEEKLRAAGGNDLLRDCEQVWARDRWGWRFPRKNAVVLSALLGFEVSFFLFFEGLVKCQYDVAMGF
jgi:hypothetical protein